MSTIHGIGGLPRIPVTPQDGRPVSTDPSEGARIQRPVPPPPTAVRESDAAFDAEGAVPTEPPPGTDPALWTILTGEERRFFAQARTMGPLTYGPRTSTPPSAGMIPGGRIDLRV